MPAQRASLISPEDNGVPSTMPIDTCKHSTMPQRLDDSHLRPTSSKLPLAAQSPYLVVNQPLSLYPTAFLTHKAPSFLINTSLYSITCLGMKKDNYC